MSISELQSGLSECEAFLIVSPENRRYLTDFESSDGFLLITRNHSVFITDSRYIEAAGAKVKNCDEILLLKKASEQLFGLKEQFGISRFFVEAEKLTVKEFNTLSKWLKTGLDTSEADARITAMRRFKSEDEKQRIIAAQRISEIAFDHILTFIRPGVTEKDIRLELECCMIKNGADNPAFDTIAISGKNTSMPHGVPGSRKIENGDFITMDYGTLKDGYRSDMTRTIAVGNVSEKQAEVYNTVLRAQLSCLNTIRAGIPCREADAAARNVIAEAGYGDFFGHGTGHGVGIDIHEAPSVGPRSEETLQAGDVVTDEPGIYIPGEFGVRIEDMVYVTPDGCENLTKCEKSLIVLQR